MFGNLRATQELAARQKFRLLFQDPLQKRNRVIEIPQLDRGDGFEPKRTQWFAQFSFAFNRHTGGTAPIIVS